MSSAARRARTRRRPRRWPPSRKGTPRSARPETFILGGFRVIAGAVAAGGAAGSAAGARAELDHPAVVGDVDVAGSVHGHVRQALEDALAEGVEELARPGQALHPVVIEVGDVEVAPPVGGQPPGGQELSRPRPRRADDLQQPPGAREALDAVELAVET